MNRSELYQNDQEAPSSPSNKEDNVLESRNPSSSKGIKSNMEILRIIFPNLNMISGANNDHLGVIKQANLAPQSSKKIKNKFDLKIIDEEINLKAKHEIQQSEDKKSDVKLETWESIREKANVSKIPSEQSKEDEKNRGQVASNDPSTTLPPISSPQAQNCQNLAQDDRNLKETEFKPEIQQSEDKKSDQVVSLNHLCEQNSSESKNKNSNHFEQAYTSLPLSSQNEEIKSDESTVRKQSRIEQIESMEDNSFKNLITHERECFDDQDIKFNQQVMTDILLKNDEISAQSYETGRQSSINHPPNLFNKDGKIYLF